MAHDRGTAVRRVASRLFSRLVERALGRLRVACVSLLAVACASTSGGVVERRDVPLPGTRAPAPEVLGPLDDHRILASVDRADCESAGCTLVVTLQEECPYVEQVERTERTKPGRDDLTTGLWIASGALAVGGAIG